MNSRGHSIEMRSGGLTDRERRQKYALMMLIDDSWEVVVVVEAFSNVEAFRHGMHALSREHHDKPLRLNPLEPTYAYGN